MNEIKDIFNSKTEKLQKENIILKESLKQKENKMNEFQGIIIGRKLIKIIIKAIIKDCFINFQILENEKGIYSIYNVTLKNKKYFPMIKIINNLIEAITSTNGIIHLIGAISKSITIINQNSTFEDIINICQMAIENIKKNDIDAIKVLFIEKSILNNNVYKEIVGKDPKMIDLLSKYLSKDENKKDNY